MSKMTHDKFEIKWAGIYPTGNKVWGWFVDLQRDAADAQGAKRWHSKECFCFWSVMGKTISLNKHSNYTWEMEALQKKKLSNGYEQVTAEQLLLAWPTFYNDLHNRYIFSTLAGNI